MINVMKYLDNKKYLTFVFYFGVAFILMSGPELYPSGIEALIRYFGLSIMVVAMVCFMNLHRDIPAEIIRLKQKHIKH